MKKTNKIDLRDPSVLTTAGYDALFEIAVAAKKAAQYALLNYGFSDKSAGKIAVADLRKKLRQVRLPRGR